LNYHRPKKTSGASGIIAVDLFGFHLLFLMVLSHWQWLAEPISKLGPGFDLILYLLFPIASLILGAFSIYHAISLRRSNPRDWEPGLFPFLKQESPGVAATVGALLTILAYLWIASLYSH
jgi:hypothetical protein